MPLGLAAWVSYQRLGEWGVPVSHGAGECDPGHAVLHLGAQPEADSNSLARCRLCDDVATS